MNGAIDMRTIAIEERYNFYIVTSGLVSNRPLALALQVLSIEHIIFSADYQFSTIEQGRAFLDNAPVNVADKEKSSHANVERLLHLERA